MIWFNAFFAVVVLVMAGGFLVSRAYLEVLATAFLAGYFITQIVILVGGK